MLRVGRIQNIEISTRLSFCRIKKDMILNLISVCDYLYIKKKPYLDSVQLKKSKMLFSQIYLKKTFLQLPKFFV